MSSLIQNFEYDIFISYRQKDNKYDGWVTEFVDNLIRELGSTFKEEVSVYFDINPHDGLLETHDVEASLKDKLRCLVFIPILSRTYCDPKSFAWEHEFKAFVEEASQDRFGLKVKLPGGNVASRVLPVRINDLDSGDIKLCESMLGGVLRSVDFIYKEPGVNRPLTPSDEEKKNLNSTRYRNQINKVALAIKEIISGMNNQPAEPESRQNEIFLIGEKPVIREKSIIVLPFENISPDPDQEYFSDGLTEEIISDLSQIQDLLVISRSSAMTFKGSNKKISEIAGDVNVRYVLEGSVRKAGNNLRITAQLIDGVNDTHLWAEKYSGTLDDIFDIQEKLSRSIVNSIKLKLHPDQNQKIAKRLLENVQAYDYYLKARRELWLWTEEALERALQYFQNALKITGENALLLIGIGEVYAHYYHAGFRMNEETLEKAEDYANKGMALDSDSSRAYYLLGLIEHARGNLRTAYKYYRHSLSLNPNELDCIFNFVYLLSMVFGKPDAAAHWARRAFEIDPLSPMNNMLLGWVDWMQERFELAYESIQKWYKIESNSEIAKCYFINILIWNQRWEEAFALIDRWIDLEPRNFLALTFLFLKYALKGEKNKALQLIKEDWRNLAWLDYHLPLNLAQGYAVLEEPEAALEWLENIINKGWCNYPLFSQSDPFLSKIREEERFKKLMERVKYEWENFEV